MTRPVLRQHHLEIRRTARFYTIGKADETVSDLWIALHGYGQLAGDFAKPFLPRAQAGRLIVVPEGLSRFYLNNPKQTIGASWMTAEDRKMDIRDYIQYLNIIFDRVVEQGVPAKAKLTVLGFSQGTATATRWLAAGQVKADRLILWGGLPAFELCTEDFQEKVPVDRIQMVTGTKDKYTAPDRQRELQPRISRGGNDVECLVFEGKHVVDEEMLASLMDDELKTPT